MTVVIGEVVTELIVRGATADAAQPAAASPAAGSASASIDEDAIVRRATERVLEVLRREWER